MALSKGLASAFTRFFVGGEMFFSRSFSTGVSVSTNDLVSKIMTIGTSDVSIVPVLDQWVEGGNTISYTFFQRMIRSLRERNRYNHALEVSEWMSKHIELGMFSSSDEAVQLDLIGHVRGIEAAESFFHSTEDSHKNNKVYGALLSCYTRAGDLEKSTSLVKKMKELGFTKSPLVLNNMLNLYSRSNLHHKIPELLSEMKEEGIRPNHFTYRICLYSYGKRSEFDSVEKLVTEMENLSHFSVDWETYTLVANLYIVAEMKEKALRYMKKAEAIVRRWAPGYNHLITLYGKLGSKEEVLRIWKLKESICGKHSNTDYKTVLSSLLRIQAIEEAEQVLKQWDPVHCDMKVPNLLLSWYGHNGMTEKAEGMLTEMVQKMMGIVPSSWNILASGYVEEDRMNDAMRCLREALALRPDNPRWVPNPELVGKILKWVEENGEVDEVVGLARGLRGVVEVEDEVKNAVEKVAERGGLDVDVVLGRIEEDDGGEVRQSTAV